jgi:hypothetical protein
LSQPPQIFTGAGGFFQHIKTRTIRILGRSVASFLEFKRDAIE